MIMGGKFQFMEYQVPKLIAFCPRCETKASPDVEIDYRMLSRFSEGIHLYCNCCREYQRMLPHADVLEAENRAI